MSQSLTKKAQLEGVLFASPAPLKEVKLCELLEIETEELHQLIQEIQEQYDSEAHGMYAAKVAGGWQFRTKKEIRPIMAKLYEKKPPRLTQATLEVLATIAYKQPIIRPEIEKIRGVDCTAVLKNLLDRELVEMRGRSDGPGNPVIYGTTPKFLEWFQIGSLEELPPLSEIQALNVQAAQDGEDLMETLEKDDGFQAEELSEVDQTLHEVQREQREFRGAIEEIVNPKPKEEAVEAANTEDTAVEPEPLTDESEPILPALEQTSLETTEDLDSAR